jgi:alpha-ketoglutarate-dependent taurine dioxygenase
MHGNGTKVMLHTQTDFESEAGFLGAGVICFDTSRTISKQSLLQALDIAGIVLLRGIEADSADEILRLGQMLGTIDVGIDEELLGPAIMHLRYSAEKARKNHMPAYFTSDFFPLHTDASYVANPPRFMLLHCVHPDPGGGGINLLADCDKALASLTERERGTIFRQVFNFLYPPNCPEGQSRAYAIYESGMWRYKHSSMSFPQKFADDVERFNQALIDNSISLLLERGDLLILDNHRIVHGRTVYKPGGYTLPGRHIM